MASCSDAPLRFSAFADRGSVISPDQIETAAAATWHDAAQPEACNAAAWERRHTLAQIMVRVCANTVPCTILHASRMVESMFTRHLCTIPIKNAKFVLAHVCPRTCFR